MVCLPDLECGGLEIYLPSGLEKSYENEIQTRFAEALRLLPSEVFSSLA